MKKKKITFKTIMLIVFLLVFILIVAGTCKRKVKALELATDSVSMTISKNDVKNGFIAIYNGEPTLGYLNDRAVRCLTSEAYYQLVASRLTTGYIQYQSVLGYEDGQSVYTYTKPHNTLYVALAVRYEPISAELIAELYEITFDYLNGYHYTLLDTKHLFLSNYFQELYENLSLTFSCYLSGMVGVWFTDYHNDFTADLRSALLQIQIGPIVDNVENYAYNDGYNNGYTLGYNTGYSEGQEGENATPVVFAVLTGVFQTLGAFLSIELLPHLTIGLFFALPLFFAVVGLILWIWRRH